MSKTVLIADDEPNIVLSLEYLMEQQGYRVHVANTGDEAIKLVEELRPDLVLLDIMMPGKSGYEVCQKVRSNPLLGATRIVILSAKGREIEVAKGLALGADAYVTKPFATRDLVAQVRKLLGDADSA